MNMIPMMALAVRKKQKKKRTEATISQMRSCTHALWVGSFALGLLLPKLSPFMPPRAQSLVMSIFKTEAPLTGLPENFLQGQELLRVDYFAV